MTIADLVDAADRVLVVGSFLRKDHPLLAQRLRQAVRKGAQVTACTRCTTTGRCRRQRSSIAAPSAGCRRSPISRSCDRARPARGAGRRRSAPTPPRRIAEQPALRRAQGDPARQRRGAASAGARSCCALAQWIAEQTGASVGFLRRSRQHGRRASGRRTAGRGRPERRGRCSRSR